MKYIKLTKMIHLTQGMQKRTTDQQEQLKVWCHKKAPLKKTKQHYAIIKHPYKVKGASTDR